MIIVANPGTHPEMMRIAGGLIAAGQVVRYLTSSSWAADSMIQRIADSPLMSTRKIGVNLRRRQLPKPISASHVVGISRDRELFVQLAMRIRPQAAAAAIGKRNDAFQKGTKRFLLEHPDVGVVIAQYTAAADTFRQCPEGVLRILNYPIAHHRWLMRAMQEEANRNPTWKALLQGHDFTPQQLKSLDEEIEMADTILVPSSFAARTFVESGVSPSKLCVIPLGCDLGRSQGADSERSSNAGLRVLFAGQATQRKGIGYLIEAVHELDDVHLTIVGSTTPEARSLIARHKNITLKASVPRSTLYDLMRQADILALPSLAEGFGLVALEAMANGTPCLLSAETFGPDLIVDGENGYILKGVSKAFILDALAEIGNDRESLAEVGKRAALTAAEFSWSRYAQDIAEKIAQLSDHAPIR
jgi:glycosyltransferase involved in cell wall biosynthesis